MKDIYLSLGSNSGDRQGFLDAALMELEKRGAKIQDRSSIYVTKGWGNVHLSDFLNMAVHLSWEVSAEQLLKQLKEIEHLLGRKDVSMGAKRDQNAYQDRPIDIDILFMGQLQMESDSLTIPHPLLRDRAFVLVPLAEIAGDFVDPLSKRTVSELLKSCYEPNKVEKLT